MSSSRGSSRVGPKVYKSSGKAHDTYHVGRGAKIYPTKSGEYKIKVPKK